MSTMVKKIINNIMSFWKFRSYTIHKSGNEYMVVKVLNTYKDRNDAMDDIVNVSTNYKSELDLLKEYNDKKRY